MLLALLHPGKIPPESTLTFVVELLEIRNGPRSHESFQEMDLNDDWKLSQQEVAQSTTKITALREDLFKRQDETGDAFLSSVCHCSTGEGVPAEGV